MKKRPRDPSQLAKMIVDIAAGDVVDSPEQEKQPQSRKQVAVLGGKKRAVALTKRRRVEIAKKAAKSRWKPKVPN